MNERVEEIFLEKLRAKNVSELRTEGQVVAYGLCCVASAIASLTRQVARLGTNDAATEMGALELLSKDLSIEVHRVGSSLGDIAGALEGIATALPETK